ncbi:hypothetical protein F0249_09785 [Vibrio sp. 03-59-1]|uniref:hypothetical protein n=1 Tax=Vibrio sp. 03-59-1 TaxID=2607607 RepID=UPI0014937265|nr:hypothetical protein [Vibrio sp. 03-59-1]NOH84102.1 hypothetical protein [Vibrio sp. 03-59-1]
MLGDIDTDRAIADKLKKCHELGISVFVKVPDGCNVWAIDPKLDQLTEADVVLSDSALFKKSQLNRYFFGGQEFDPLGFPRINTSELYASTKLDDIELLELNPDDVKKLAASHEVSVNTFKGVFLFDGEDDVNLCRSVPVSKYVFEVDESHNVALKNKLSVVKFTDVKLKYAVCKQAASIEPKFNVPLDYIEIQNVVAQEGYILEADVSKLLFNQVDYEKSIYHLEPEYHVSSSFLELSKVGFKIYVKNDPTLSGGVTSFIGRQCHSFHTKPLREAGAFLISPKPTGRAKNKGCQFPYLKEIFDTYWQGAGDLTGKEVKQRIVQVTNAIKMLGISDHNIKGAEMIIRPDQYKKYRGVSPQ